MNRWFLIVCAVVATGFAPVNSFAEGESILESILADEPWQTEPDAGDYLAPVSEYRSILRDHAVQRRKHAAAMRSLNLEELRLRILQEAVRSTQGAAPWDLIDFIGQLTHQQLADPRSILEDFVAWQARQHAATVTDADRPSQGVSKETRVEALGASELIVAKRYVAQSRLASLEQRVAQQSVSELVAGYAAYGAIVLVPFLRQHLLHNLMGTRFPVSFWPGDSMREQKAHLYGEPDLNKFCANFLAGTESLAGWSPMMAIEFVREFLGRHVVEQSDVPFEALRARAHCSAAAG